MFESLSSTYQFQIPDFPPEWIPLTHLYDPDLPLFPILYIHCLNPSHPVGTRPGPRDRVYGYIHHINLDGTQLTVSLLLNKDLNDPRNAVYVNAIETEARSRLGIEDPVTLPAINGQLGGALANANQLVEELWYQVVQSAFGNMLPFGKVWDPVYGLVRWLASFYSGGRKGELIQTHSFMKDFGVKIPMAHGHHADFFLLPTWKEFTDISNPLAHFDEFSKLVQAASQFVSTHSTTITLGTHSFSKFSNRPAGCSGMPDKSEIMTIFGGLSQFRTQLLQCFGAFDRGPPRTVIALQMLHDLRQGNWNPSTLSNTDCGDLYQGLKGCLQSPKVIALYAQQCFGNDQVLPIDIWIETFLSAPMSFKPSLKKWLEREALQTSSKWGRIERLIWVASQARKVHATVCTDILWCIRYGAPQQGNSKPLRSANPLACKNCKPLIRGICPAYAAIENATIKFNPATDPHPGDFVIETSQGNNTTGGQTFKKCYLVGKPQVQDVYSADDMPGNFSNYPSSSLTTDECTVADFMNIF